MWSANGYRKLVRASGIYDLVVTIGFATPWSFAALHDGLVAVQAHWGLAGSIPAFEPLHVLMANLMGSIVCVWAWLRIRDPQPRFGHYDAAGRVLFACWQAYALMQGATHLLLAFLALELLWAVAQLIPVRNAPVPVR